MPSRAAIFCLILAGPVAAAPAAGTASGEKTPGALPTVAGPLGADKDYASARRAMAASLPGVALAKAADLLAGKRFSDADTRLLRLLVVEAAVRAGRTAAVPDLSESDLPDTAEARFWMAQWLALAGHLTRASSLLEDIAAHGPANLQPFAAFTLSSLLVTLREPAAAVATLAPASESKDKGLAFRARLRQAELHLLLEQAEAARAALAALPAPPSPWDEAAVAYVKARLAEASGEFSAAMAGFENVAANPRGLPIPVVHASMLAAARTRGKTGDGEGANDALVAFVNDHPDSPMLPAAFQAMEVSGVFRDPARASDVESWIKSGQTRLAALALLHWSRAEGPEKSGATLKALDQFLATWPKVPQATDITLRKAEILIGQGDAARAASTLAGLDNVTLSPEQQATRRFLYGEVKRSSGHLEEAAEEFAEAAARAAPDTAAAARYNAALCAMLADDSDGFEKSLGILLQSADPAAPLGARLLLERGLYLSSRDFATARLMLWRFLEAAPKAPECARAYLALAEIALRDQPPQPQKARAQLEKIPASAAGEILCRRDYTMVWAADIAGDTQAVVQAANAYLARWPGSAEAEEIRFKAGATLAADGQHAAARGYFEVLAETPESPWREQALFQAARSASLCLTDSALDDASTLFQKVVDLQGALRFQARQEQARILFRQGRADDAIALLKETLAAKSGPDPATRRGILSQQAEILLDRRGNDEAAAIEAGKIFAGLWADPEAPAQWRNRASWFLGRALLATGDEENALRTWYDTLDAALPAGQAPVESYWAFRCGMSAIDLLGKRQDWAAAAALALRLAEANAPRSQEARALHERIRLEHFLWELPAKP